MGMCARGWALPALWAVFLGAASGATLQRDCPSGFEYCDPYVMLGGAPLAIISADPSQLNEVTLEPTNSIIGVALFAFASARSAWLLPSTIGYLTSVLYWASEGGLRGSFPTQLGRMRSLLNLEIKSSAFLIGTLPSQLGLASSLTALSIDDVPNLTGTIPSQIGQLPGLLTFIVQNCSLHGTLPAQMAALHLDHLELRDNNLVGTFPQGGTSRWVELANNGFTGPIPEVPEGVLTYDIGHNAFDGTVPTTLGPHLSALTSVGLHNNLLTGTLPSQIAAMTNLRELHVHSNRLSGALPTQLGLMTRLSSLRVDQNTFSGTLPSELALLTGLAELSVGANRLGGRVPSQLALLTGLTALNISHNAFVGSLPHQLAHLPELQTTSVEGNSLEGRAPSDVWEQECDNSGLDSKACEYDCPACRDGAAELLRCDWRGRGQWCASVLGLWASAAGVLVLVGAAFKGSSPRIPVWTLAVKVGVMTFAVFETFLDLLFALRSGGVIGLIAFSAFVAGRAAGLFLGVATLVRWRRHWWQVVVGAALCSVHASALRALLPPEVQAKSRAVRRWVVVLALTESLVEGSLQAYSIGEGSRDIVTSLSLLFSTASLIATVTVMAVLGLANYHAAKAQVLVTALDNESNNGAPVDSQGDEPEGEEGAKGEDGKRGAKRTCQRISRFLACLTCCTAAAVAVLPGRPLGQATVHRHTAVREEARALSWPSNRQPWEPQQRATVLWSQGGRTEGWAGGSNHKSLLQCPPGNEFRPPVMCLGGQVVIIFDTTGELQNNATVFEWAMQEPGVRLLHLNYPKWPLPSTIQTMQRLGYLGLFQFQGPLPTQVGTLTALRVLALTWALASDGNPIPSEIGHSGSLELCLMERVATTLPSQIGRIPTLRSLSMTTASTVSAWQLPTQLGMLGALTGMTIADSNAVGPLPSQLGLLGATLLFLDLGRNAFSGAVPSELAMLSQLEFVSLVGSTLEGTLPGFLQLPSLKHCEMGDQLLQGSLPSDIPFGSALEFVDLGGNRLGGTIPSQLGRATAMTHLSLFGNPLGGSVPSQLGLLTLLTHLSLHSLGLRGPIPSQLGRLSLLSLLHVHGNSLQGPVPSQLALLTLLTDVSLADNALKEPLDGAFQRASRAVWLKDCDFSGVDEEECARECPRCDFGAARVRACNGRGFRGICAPPWLVLLVVSLMAGVMRLVVRRVSEDELSVGETVVATLLSLVATTHVLLDVLFALLAPPAIRGCSFGVIVVGVFSRFVLSTGEFFRTQLHKHVAAQQQGATRGGQASPSEAREKRDSSMDMGVWARSAAEGLGKNDVRRAALDTKLFAAALVLCILDPSALLRVFHMSTEHDSLRTKVLGAKLVVDLPHLVLQAVVIDTRSDNSFAVQALALTVLSVVLGVTEWAFGDFLTAIGTRPTHSTVSSPQREVQDKEEDDQDHGIEMTDKEGKADHEGAIGPGQEEGGLPDKAEEDQDQQDQDQG